MKKIMLRIAAGLGLTFLIAVLAIVGIRFFSDGPLEMLPGGPMSGSTTLESFPGFGGQSSGFIELQVEDWRPSSRTVIGFLYNKDLYIPSVKAESKWWPHQVLANPEVIVRYQGVLYGMRATRITDSALILELRETTTEVETVVSTPEMFMADTTWFFRLDMKVE